MHDLLTRYPAITPPGHPGPASGRDSDHDGRDDGYADCADSPNEVIRGRRQVAHILRQAAQAGWPITLSTPALDVGAGSRVLAITPDGDEIFLRPAADAGAQAALLGDVRLNLTLRRLETSLLLSMTGVRAATYKGQACIAAPLPEWALSSQMRVWQRIKPPSGDDYTLSHVFRDADNITARVSDLSEGGFGIIVPHLPLRGIRIGDVWENARLVSPRATISPVRLKVCHYRCSSGGQHLGLTLGDTSEGQVHKLQRLLLRLQRTRS